MVVIALTKWLSKILHTKYKYLGISAISWNCLQITNSSININWPHNLCVLFWRFFSYIKILTKYVPSWKTCRHCYCDVLTASLFAHELQSHLKKTLKTHELCELADFSRGISYSMSTSWGIFLWNTPRCVKNVAWWWEWLSQL